MRHPLPTGLAISGFESINQSINHIGLKRLKRILNNRKMAIVLAGGFSNGELVKILHGDQASNMEELYSTQEEADSRLLLHAIHASRTTLML